MRGRDVWCHNCGALQLTARERVLRWIAKHEGLRVSQTAIARAVGLSRETVTREIKELVDGNHVRRDGSRYWIAWRANK